MQHIELLHSVDSNFYHDTAKVEFNGGLARLKDQRPSNSTFYAGYNQLSINANWGAGNLNVINSVGGPGNLNGKLNLSSINPIYVDYDAVANAELIDEGTIDFKYTPKYGGAPGNDQTIFSILGPSGNEVNNYLALVHDSSAANLELSLNDNAGANLVSGSFGAWSPILNKEYNIRLTFRRTFASGNTTTVARLFIDGFQFGITLTYTNIALNLVRDTNVEILRLGGEIIPVASNFIIDEFVVYTAELNTANYTVSDVMQPQTVYATDNPTVKSKFPILSDEILSFAATLSAGGSDAVRFAAEVNGKLKYYYNGSWIDSTLGYIHTNTAAEVAAAVSTLLVPGSQLRMVAYLHSADGTTTPTLTELDMTFNYGDITSELPAKCKVKVRCIDWRAEPVAGAVVKMWPVLPNTAGFLAHNSKNALVTNNVIDNMTLDDGTIDIFAIPSDAYKEIAIVKYRIEAVKESIGYKAEMLFEVPNLLETPLQLLISPLLANN